MNYLPKILQISNRVPFPLNEGGTIGIYNYTRGFSQAGCRVTLFALSPRKHHEHIVDAQFELTRYSRFKWVYIDTEPDFIAAFFNLFTFKSYNIQRFYSKDFKEELIKELKNESYDIIQIEGTYPAIYTNVVLKHSGNAKVVLRQHNVEYQIWERMAHNLKNPLKKWYFNLLARRLKRFERKHLNQFDAIIPVTPDDGDLFKKLGCIKPIFVSPSGIDTVYWHPNKRGGNVKHIYHIGSLEWMPNVEALMWFLDEVWPIIYNANPEIEFFVAGKGMPEHIKNISVKGVHMIGEVDDAADFISEKAVNVVPLKSGSGIRLKILEAMSAGKAIVSTTIGAQGIHYTENEDILIADSPKAFANAVLKVCDDPELCNNLGRQARNLIEMEYSNTGVILKLLDFYKQL